MVFKKIPLNRPCNPRPCYYIILYCETDECFHKLNLIFIIRKKVFKFANFIFEKITVCKNKILKKLCVRCDVACLFNISTNYQQNNLNKNKRLYTVNKQHKTIRIVISLHTAHTINVLKVEDEQ